LRAHLLHTPTFDHFATWEIDGAMSYIANGDAYLMVNGWNPDLLSVVPPERMRAHQIKAVAVGKPINQAISGADVNWLYVGLPVIGWARRVFPGIPDEDALMKLWAAVFETCRINQPDPAAAWQAHVHALLRRKAYLTAKQYTALHYPL
jgi:aminopeptidase